MCVLVVMIPFFFLLSSTSRRRLVLPFPVPYPQVHMDLSRRPLCV
jgi:hypothetical protein